MNRIIKLLYLFFVVPICGMQQANDINVRNDHGHTQLGYALVRNDYSPEQRERTALIVKKLLYAGADWSGYEQLFSQEPYLQKELDGYRAWHRADYKCRLHDFEQKKNNEQQYLAGLAIIDKNLSNLRFEFSQQYVKPTLPKAISFWAPDSLLNSKCSVSFSNPPKANKRVFHKPGQNMESIKEEE